MLDVHPPHKPMHGAGEFFLHLFTITVGLLIAVGIEAAVTRHEQHKLAEDARASMTAEIRRNQENVAGALHGIDQEQTRLNANLAQLAPVQLKGAGVGKDVQLDVTSNVTNMEHTAWRTAQATNALAYMPYEDAQKFSSIYEDAQSFDASQESWQVDEATMLGLVRRYLANDQPLSKEGADAMAQQVGVWQAHLLTLRLKARLLQEEQTAFLEGRAPAKHLSERMGN